MFGLVGKKLGHSFSKKIHNLLGNDKYELFETNSIKDFLKQNDINGINVTIPYKTEVIPYLDELDNIAKETNSVNTIINKNGKLIGYNTDYYGLKETLGYKKVSIKGKNILILGNGSVSKTVYKLMTDLNANKIVKLCRTIKSDKDFLFNDFNDFLDFDIIINSTPVGMYPNNNQNLLIDLKQFKKLEIVIDLVYNPLKTKLLLEAEALKINSVNGLYMLVLQAIKAHELFVHKSIPLNIANKVYRKIFNQQLNYVLIGLPLSGKSKYARLIENISSKEIKDTDSLIEEKYNLTIPEIFEQKGEKTFRQYEADVIKELYKKNSLVISTGGGLIENQENMELLKQNGVIIFLYKDPQKIAKKNIYGRPLLKDSNDIIKLANRRMPIYEKYTDVKIIICKQTDYHMNEIKEKIDEYISR